jgi:hypothetical protein
VCEVCAPLSAVSCEHLEKRVVTKQLQRKEKCCLL